MATPRVFISSTYYDLKHVRNDVCNFITSLGYTSVMHDKGGVAYTQIEPLENSCYSELSTCDIVVCIIGNHFGTQSSNSDFSITMEELRAAIKNKKKIYIFIAKDVYTENRTYLQNRDSGSFKPAYVDDIKIHEFIAELCETVKNNPIAAFDTTTDIIESLRSQFAGLFQSYLAREASLTESKTAYDLQETTENFKELLADFRSETEKMFGAFEGTYFTTNNTLYHLRSLLELKETVFIVQNQAGLEEFLKLAGFSRDEDNETEHNFIYRRQYKDKIQTLTLSTSLFDFSDEEWRIKRLPMPEVKKRIEWDVQEVSLDDDLPF